MAETPIVSSTLQKDFRDNFPSQVSSGRDLHVSDVIVPIVDFSTSTAVTGLGVSLQQALDFNVTTFDLSNSSSTIVNTPGFWRVFGYCGTKSNTSVQENNTFSLTDGVSTKVLVDFNVQNGFGGEDKAVVFDFIVFLKTGVSLVAAAGAQGQRLNGSCRQLADISGTLQNPDGYTGS